MTPANRSARQRLVIAVLLLASSIGVAAQPLFRSGFEAGSGVRLGGADAASASDQLIAHGPFAVAAADIHGDVPLSRLLAILRPGATVAQVNDALAAEDAYVSMMRPGLAALSLAVPPQPDRVALDAMAARLQATGAFTLVRSARFSNALMLPPGEAGSEAARDRIAHLLPTRFPAAWNLSRLATRDCQSRRVELLLPDIFHPQADAATRAVLHEVGDPILHEGDAATYADLAPDANLARHGYRSLGIIASPFDAFNATGAMPFADCLQVTAYSVYGYLPFEYMTMLADDFVAGEKRLISRSLGNNYRLCPGGACTPAAFDGARSEMMDLIAETLALGAAMRAGWDDVLLVNAAGNGADDPETAIYRGFGTTFFATEPNLLAVLALPDESFDARLRQAFSDPQYWAPTAGHAAYPPLMLGDAHFAQARAWREAMGLPDRSAEFAAVTVGVTNTAHDALELRESFYSSFFPDVHAPADPIYVIDRMMDFGGTSFAAPQVSGLAAYLWLLSPELRALPAIVTSRAIRSNVDERVPGVYTIDAYATSLSIDAAALPTPSNAPARLALFDVDGNERFDQFDLAEFVARLESPDAPDRPSYSRSDLNGDGVAGGTGTARFDLDRVGSTRFGAALYGNVHQTIEGTEVAFDERSLTDIEILCYYAHSALYTGDPASRRDLVRALCGPPAPSSVEVDFAVFDIAISGRDAFLVSETVVSSPQEVIRPLLYRTNVGSLQIGEPEDGGGPGTDLSRPVADFTVHEAIVGDPTQAGPLLAVWRVPGEEQQVGNRRIRRDHFWARSFDPQSRAWNDAIEVGSAWLDRNSHPPMRAAIDMQGNAMLVWIAPEDALAPTPVQRVFETHVALDSGDWSEPQAIPSAGPMSIAQVLAVDGIFLLPEARSSAGVQSVGVRRFAIASNSWSEHSLASGGNPGGIRLAMDARGGAIATWHDGAVEWVSHLDPANDTWGTPLTLGVLGAAPNHDPVRLSADARGNAVLVSLAVDGQRVSRRYDATARTWSQRVPTMAQTAPALAVNGHGAVLQRAWFSGNIPPEDWVSLALLPYRGGDGEGSGWQTLQPLLRVDGEYATILLASLAVTSHGDTVMYWWVQIRGSDNRPVIVDRRVTVIPR